MSIHQRSYNSLVTSNYDSVATVIEDLISDRTVWRKVVCLLMCLTFLFNAWAVIVLHLVPYTDETILEVSVSVAVLIAGQYIGTGIVNGYVYWKRWSKTTVKSRAKEVEQNKEAWVCMRITLTLLGLAPVVRYVESLVVIKRMVTLEKQYMSDTVALAKDTAQPSSLPTGSLISGPSMGARSGGPFRSSATNSTPINPNRMRALDAGIAKVFKVRRQFRRTEQDAGIVALASGVLGAGPFLISQGVLYFRRVGMNYQMPLTTWLGILVCCITGVLWLCTGLTHYYPAPYDQSEFDFDRGIGQVNIGGLVLLFLAHFFHVSIRCGTLVLFTGQFQWIVLAVVAFHYVFVLICLITARACTETVYSNPAKFERSSISGNIFSDLMFSYVSIFEFVNAYAKFTRTRYLLYYFIYYLENAAMVGAWYVHFAFPETWYYLPSLLIIVVVQFLGFILLQIYLFLFSKARRKRTLCGFCFAHLDPEETQRVHFEAVQHGTSRQSQIVAPTISVLGSRTESGHGALVKKSSTGIYDPVFGEKIGQVAVPKSRSKSRHYEQSNRPSIRPIQDTKFQKGSSLLPEEHAPQRDRYKGDSRILTDYDQRGSMLLPEDHVPRRDRHLRTSTGRNTHQEIKSYPSYADLADERETRYGTRKPPLDPMSMEEAVEHEMREHRRPPSSQQYTPKFQTRRNDRYPSLTQIDRRESPMEVAPPQKPQPGVFRPKPDQNWRRQRWPYTAKSRGL